MFNFSIVTNYLKKYKNNYNIKKENKYYKLSKSPKLNIYRNDTYFFDKKFNEHVNTFINFLEAKPNINLKLFYKNLKTLIIKERKKFFIKTHTKGHYNSSDNKIVVLEDDNFYAIYHELLHCASRKIEGNKMNTGFHKFVVDENAKKILFNEGKALNEGYTTLLEKRYFSLIEHTQERGYVIEEFIASLLEKIVTSEEMEKLCFNADFDGLVNYLKDFSNEEDIYLFFKYFDKVFVNSKEKLTPKEAKYCYEFIACFLLKTYICKLIYLLQNDSITRKEFEELFDDFVEKLSINTVYDKKNTYNFLTPEITDQILDQVNDDLDNRTKKKDYIKNI